MAALSCHRSLDVIDHFMNNYGLVLSALFEVVLVAWVVRQLRSLQQHVNERSYLPAGTWWIVSLMVITPVLLGIVTALNFYQEPTSRYGEYPLSGLLIFGWGLAILLVVIAFIFQNIKSRDGSPETENAQTGDDS